MIGEAPVFDYIVIGAGSAGCVLAHRLTEQSGVTVLLLEAGPADSNPWIHIPAGFIRTINDPRVNWCYESEPEPGTGNRPIPVPRGRVLGGSSSINGMVYVRGQPRDYDGWAQLGNRGWSFTDVLPYFRKSENQERGADDLHGVGGPLDVSDQREGHEICDAFIAAGEAIGLPRNDDINGPEQEGIGYFQLTQRRGRRVSTADAYLRPAMARTNLKVETGALAGRILLDGRRAVGVEYMVRGQPRLARAGREVLLCGGTVNSPQLLELSGIGQPELLRGLGIEVRHALPGVGENLQDHYVVRQSWRVTRPITYNERSRGLPLLREVARYAFGRRGLLSLSVASIAAFVRTRPELETPDVQFHITPATFRDAKTRRLEREPGMTVAPCQLRPDSRGSVHVKSADPSAAPAIRPNFLATQGDRDTVIAGIRFGRRLAGAPPLDPYRGPELSPGDGCQSDDELLDFARRTGATVYHPAGTCRMGSDPNAVVDDRLRVHGLQGLRVVDASVMPTVTSGNTNAPTIMIAEKAADMIRSDAG